MTPVILLLALAFVGFGGLAWVTVPLVRDAARRSERRPSGMSDDVQRALDLMDDLDTERVRGAVSDVEHAEQTSELRRQAAVALDAANRQRARASVLVDGLLAGQAESATAPSGAVAPLTSPRRPIAWLITAAALVVALVAVVLVVTLGARGGLGEQTAIGNVGVAAIAGAAAGSTDPDLVVVAHPAGVQLSRDGGATWQVAEVARPTRSVVAVPAGFIAISNAGLLGSNPPASLWEGRFSAPELIHISLGRGTNRLVGIGADGAIHEAIDGGASWTTLELEAPPDITGLVAVETPERVLLVSTSTEGVLAATPRGTWRSANGFVNGALPTVNVRSIYYEPGSGDSYESPTGQRFEGAVYAATDAGVFKTIDGMQTWSRLPLRGDIAVITGSAADPRGLYAIARDGTVYRSRDAGVSWG